MSIVVTQRPIVDLGDNESAFNAVGNPIVYKMQRKDFTFNQVNNSSGFIQLQFNGSDLTASFTVGDSLYVKSDNGVYDLFGKVTARSFSTNTLVTIDQAYVSSAPGGFVNNDTLKSSYRLSVSVYNGSDVLLNDSAFIYSPNRKGELIINVASIVRAYLNPDIDIDLTTTGVVEDTNAFIEFYIKYTELWLGGSSSEVSDTANRIYGVLGARQIPAQYGGNMLPYVVFEDPEEILNDTAFNVNWTNQGSGVSWTLGATELNVTLANQTSKRARRSLNFVKGNTYQIRIVGTQSDSEGVNYTIYVGTQQGSFSCEDAAFDETVTIVPTENVSYFEIQAQFLGVTIEIDITNVVVSEIQLAKWLTKLTRPKAWLGYPFVLSAIVNSIDDVIAFNLLNSEFDYSEDFTLADHVVNGFTESGEAFIEIGGTELTEVLQIQVVEPCANPIMLMTRNTLGGALQQLFSYSQEYTFDYGNGRKAARKLLSVTGLTINEWEALQDFIGLGEVYKNNIVEFTSSTIKTSSRIGHQVYEVFPDGSKVGVIVIPTQNSTLTKQVKHTFEIEIEYPEEFVP